MVTAKTVSPSRKSTPPLPHLLKRIIISLESSQLSFLFSFILICSLNSTLLAQYSYLQNHCPSTMLLLTLLILTLLSYLTPFPLILDGSPIGTCSCYFSYSTQAVTQYECHVQVTFNITVFDWPTLKAKFSVTG